MKLNATVKISVVNIYEEMQDVIVRTRSYTIIDSDELQEALKNMRSDIGILDNLHPSRQTGTAWDSVKWTFMALASLGRLGQLESWDNLGS